MVMMSDAIHCDPVIGIGADAHAFGRIGLEFHAYGPFYEGKPSRGVVKL